jgi:hypothetical protein
LLVSGLVPYWRCPLKIITGTLLQWLKSGRSLYATLENLFTNLEEASEQLLNTIGSGQLYQFKKMYEVALMKYVVWQGCARSEYSLDTFVRVCAAGDCAHAAALSEAYYERNGGHAGNSQFLFGVASQFRC